MGVPWQPQLLAHLAGVMLAAGLGVQPNLPPPENISYVLDESSCILSVQWDPAISRGNCSKELEYHTGLFNGTTWVEECWNQELSRKMAVFLGRNMFFGLQTSCTGDDDKYEGEWFKIPLAQNGTAETGATNISCVCHNLKWMSCSWKRGRKAPRDTNYRLYFGHEDMEKRQPCTNHSINGDTFRCIFPINCSGLRTIVLSVRSDSEDVQPVCMFTKEGREESDYPVKLDPPINLNVMQSSNVYFLTWHRPSSWNGICYQVEINGIKQEPKEDSTNVTIPIEPKKYHILRVRAVLGEISTQCKNVRGLWSEWSKPVSWDDRDKSETLNIVLFVMIPLCAAILTIILLVYLKRIQLLIFPKIPDPEKVLKRMFEEQREEYLPADYSTELIKPDTIKTDHKMS
ncbi:interleukin-13 receptor subunit alpha-1-like [Vipera latastei]